MSFFYYQHEQKYSYLNVFVFLNPNMITNFEFRIFFITIFILFSIRIRCNLNSFNFNASMNCVIVFINNIFEIAVTCLKILFLNVLMNLSATTDFHLLYVEYISMLFFFKNILKRLL